MRVPTHPPGLPGEDVPQARPQALWGQNLPETFQPAIGWAEPRSCLLGCWGDPGPVVSGSRGCQALPLQPSEGLCWKFRQTCQGGGQEATS